MGPPAGQRFSAAWLKGLANFVAWKYQEQNGQPQQAQQAPPPPPAAEAAQGEHATPARTPVAAERLPGSPARPPVTVERLPAPSSQQEAAGAAEQPAAEPRPDSAGPAGTESSHMGGGDSDLDEDSAGCSRGDTPGSSASCDSELDLGWAALLAPAAAEAAAASSAASAQASGSEGAPSLGAHHASTAAATAGGSSSSSNDGEGSQGSRTWWPPSPTALADAQPVAVEERPAGPDAPLPGGSRVQLSLRLERMALTDRCNAPLPAACCPATDPAQTACLQAQLALAPKADAEP